ncbi:glycosyl transferase [Flavobacterium palustre]|uniref:Glycosyl transferase n=1 Tax=Flavobacterium palustre TaxID=1476463 RepID=A0ABQ1HI51_9FLAO|nr:glycosyltransferase [Flavobacterium palustre]GGA78793.1 glycosyl transferase [Flavobacterium palustre]
MMLFLIIILSIYFTTILLLIYGFSKIKNFNSVGLTPKTAFTIVVPFRNEAGNLPLLLESFSKLNYPIDLFEVILVDDASTDKFQIPNSKFQISIINNIRISKSPKKDAITTAIPLAKNEWIITTDADCVVSKNWLLTLDNYIQTHKVSMIASTVTHSGNDSFLHHFQQLDLASLQGATIGSFGIGKGFMCNGANLAYTQSLFQELNGFEGNNTIASGDDVFLLQKAIASRSFGTEKIHYLKSNNTIVNTKPLDDWKSLFYQRVRWASKTSSYQSNFGKLLGLVVFGGNISLLFIVCCLLFRIGDFYSLLFFIITKSLIDFILIYKTNQFLKIRTQSFLLSSLLYPFFSATVALYAVLGKYEWKGRWF